MRLWHQKIIKLLPRQQLLGQHRECCALRGKGWGMNHSTVNYVFTYTKEELFLYHMLVMNEMLSRKYNITPDWFEHNYEGKQIGYTEYKYEKETELRRRFLRCIFTNKIIYKEHDKTYLDECLDNLKGKGIIIEV